MTAYFPGLVQTLQYKVSSIPSVFRTRTYSQTISGCIKMGPGIDVLTGQNQLLLLDVAWCIYATSNVDNNYLSNLIKEWLT